MKNKGFTLIELLAVIVILAIIALIATPIILGIINDARESAKERSAEMVFTGVQYAYTTAMYSSTSTGAAAAPTLAEIKNNLKIENAPNPTLDNTSNPTKITIVTDDSVTCVVTASGTTFNVKCGDGTTADKYLNANVDGSAVSAG